MSKVVFITGSTDGIGKQTAIDLSNAGYKVLIHGRNLKKVRNTVDELKSKYNSKAEGFVADFSSLNEVKKLANELLKKFECIDVLINNAGVYMKQKTITIDGYESTFQINHLSHFLLTNLLLPQIIKSNDGRIINVSSIAHNNAELDFKNLNAEKFFDSYYAYALSKLANVLFTKELNKKINGTSISTFSLHPGVISTKLLSQGFNITGESVKKGAETSIFLATENNVVKFSGEYFIDKKVSPSHPITYDEKIQTHFWNISFELVKKYLN